MNHKQLGDASYSKGASHVSLAILFLLVLTAPSGSDRVSAHATVEIGKALTRSLPLSVMTSSLHTTPDGSVGPFYLFQASALFIIVAPFNSDPGILLELL
jgi:hypothetical protein